MNHKKLLATTTAVIMAGGFATTAHAAPSNINVDITPTITEGSVTLDYLIEGIEGQNLQIDGIYSKNHPDIEFNHNDKDGNKHLNGGETITASVTVSGDEATDIVCIDARDTISGAKHLDCAYTNEDEATMLKLDDTGFPNGEILMDMDQFWNTTEVRENDPVSVYGIVYTPTNFNEATSFTVGHPDGASFPEGTNYAFDYTDANGNFLKTQESNSATLTVPRTPEADDSIAFGVHTTATETDSYRSETLTLPDGRIVTARPIYAHATFEDGSNYSTYLRSLITSTTPDTRQDAEPVVEEPVVDEPVVEEPVVDEPVVEEPVVDEPVVDEPVVDEPVVDEPVVEEPVVEEPVVEEPVVDEPVNNDNEPQIQDDPNVLTKPTPLGDDENRNVENNNVDNKNEPQVQDDPNVLTSPTPMGDDVKKNVENNNVDNKNEPQVQDDPNVLTSPTPMGDDVKKNDGRDSDSELADTGLSMGVLPLLTGVAAIAGGASLLRKKN